MISSHWSDAAFSGRRIGPIGTALRALFGVIFLGIALVFGPPLWWQVVLDFVGFPLAFAGWLLLGTRWRSQNGQANDPFAHLTFLVFVVAPLIYEPTRCADLLFVGGSMLLAALRGYAGCEISALSNWLLRRHDQLFCPLFTPLDVLDRRP